MTTSEAGVKFIEVFEGFRSNAYLDQGGVATIGFGHTSGVKEGDTCTMAQAEQWLKEDLSNAERTVNALAGQFVDLTQNEFDALVSLTFNIGGGNFSQSTVLRELREGEPAKAADAFLMWDKIKGIPNTGLHRRRTAEKALFLNQTVSEVA